jgi:hypothetical protein
MAQHARTGDIPAKGGEDGSSRDLYVRSRRAQRGTLARRLGTRKEAARLETSEAISGPTPPAQLLVI